MYLKHVCNIHHFMFLLLQIISDVMGYRKKLIYLSMNNRRQYYPPLPFTTNTSKNVSSMSQSNTNRRNVVFVPDSSSNTNVTSTSSTINNVGSKNYENNSMSSPSSPNRVVVSSPSGSNVNPPQFVSDTRSQRHLKHQRISYVTEQERQQRHKELQMMHVAQQKQALHDKQKLERQQQLQRQQHLRRSTQFPVNNQMQQPFVSASSSAIISDNNQKQQHFDTQIANLQKQIEALENQKTKSNQQMLHHTMRMKRKTPHLTNAMERQQFEYPNNKQHRRRKNDPSYLYCF